jgi:hypothetical protein
MSVSAAIIIIIIIIIGVWIHWPVAPHHNWVQCLIVLFLFGQFSPLFLVTAASAFCLEVTPVADRTKLFPGSASSRILSFQVSDPCGKPVTATVL